MPRLRNLEKVMLIGMAELSAVTPCLIANLKGKAKIQDYYKHGQPRFGRIIHSHCLYRFKFGCQAQQATSKPHELAHGTVTLRIRNKFYATLNYVSFYP